MDYGPEKKLIKFRKYGFELREPLIEQKHVCVFSFLHQLKTWHCPHSLLRACCRGAGRAAIDGYLIPAGPTAANPPHAAAASGRADTNRQADGHRAVTWTLLHILRGQCQ